MSTNPPPKASTGGRAPGALAACAIVWAAALASVALRLWARRLNKIRLGLDDWLVIAATPICTALFIDDIFSFEQGLGKHVETIGEEKTILFLRTFFVGQLFWATAIPFWKISILALYNRVFGNLRYIRIWTWSLSIYTIVMTLAFLLTIGLQCVPLKGVWDLAAKPRARCINFTLFSEIGSGLDLLSSIAILILPMPPIWALQKSVSDRIGLTGLFLLGSLTCVVSLVRLIELYLTTKAAAIMDPSYYFVPIAILGTAQPCMGVICASLPTLTPLLRIALSGRRRRRYYNYADAARRIETNVHAFDRKINSSQDYGKNNVEHSAFRPDGYGFRAGRADSPPLELRDMLRTQPGSSSVAHERQEVYVSTDIEVEAHRIG